VSRSVVICLPTYNERANLERMVAALLTAQPAAKILIVDDASPDGTGDLADRLAADDERVRVMHRSGKDGLGRAYVDGIRLALAEGADLVVTMDCDFSHDPLEVARLLEQAGERNVVIGSRYVAGGAVANWSVPRRVLSRLGSLYARLVLRVHVHDLTSGFKCYGREALVALDLDGLDAQGYAFQIETTYRALQAGCDVVEVPITFRDRERGASKMTPRIALEAFLLLPRLRLRWLRGPLLAVSAVAALAVVARLPHLWSESFWQDEVASARILRAPTFAGMLHGVAHTESTPPLWYALGWLLHRGGLPIVDVRLVSVLAGGATAAIVLLLARRTVSAPSALAAGLLVALGYEFLVHGHELRAYALLALLAAAFAGLLLRAVRTQAGRDLAGLAACTAAGLLTHYFFLFTVAAALLWLLAEPELRNRRRRPVAAIVGGGLLAAPWLPAALQQYRADRFWWIGPFSLHQVVDTPWHLFAPALHPLRDQEECGVAFLVLCVLGAVRLARASARGRLVVALAFGPVLVAAALWAADVRIYSLRNTLEAGPFFAIVAASSLAWAPRRVRAAATMAVAAVLAAGFFAYGTTAIAAPYQGIAGQLVREGWSAPDPIAVFGGANGFFSFRSPLEWYLPRQPVLALGERTDRACATVFAVVSRRSRARRLARLGDVSSHWIDGYDVLRLRLRGWRAERALGRPALITAAVGHAGCVEPVLTGHVAPLALGSRTLVRTRS